MIRWIIGLSVLALVASFGVSEAQAAKKAKKKTEPKISGQIQAVSDDNKLITISGGTAKKAKDPAAANKGAAKKGTAKKGKKAASGNKEIRLSNSTTIDYVGIDNQDEKKLQKGYYVLATLDDEGAAKTLSVSKSPFDAGKAKAKKKKNV